MLFNSLTYAIFLSAIFFISWFVFKENIRYQNLFLLAASYVFYGWWDWRFLSLILISSMVDFWVGFRLGRTSVQQHRKRLLLLSIFANIGILGGFKYFNFFSENFVRLAHTIGFHPDLLTLHVILPVGISFYTFQTMSYSIDVYRRKMEPTKDWVSFFTFVAFFPQLVAGPIERAKHLLPQFYQGRHFDENRASDGLRQILWGLFKKVVIADNAAVFVDRIYGDYTVFSGSTMWVATLFFAFQIYGDFSGYSDIAIGSARLLGFNLRRNFAFPYFSRDIAEFWRRWHISLSSWFRDYVYIPLGGSRGKLTLTITNTFIIFAVSGFWHGANWTFLVWGLVNAIYFIPVMLLNKNRRFMDSPASGRVFPGMKESFQILFTFGLVIVGWVFFRSPSLSTAGAILTKMFSSEIFSQPASAGAILPAMTLLLIIVEWFQREKEHGLDLSGRNFSRPVRWVGYYTLMVCIFAFGGSSQPFIYFQF